MSFAILDRTNLTIEIGGIALACRLAGEEGEFHVPANHHPFLSQRDPDLVLDCRYRPVPEHLLGGEMVFDTEPLWSLHQVEGGQMWRQMSATVQPIPQRAAFFPSEMGAIQVYTASFRQMDGLWTYPIHHPLDKFLYAHLLPWRQGMTCHASSVDDRGRGFLFVGVSESGKSTMAGLWHGQEDVRVLSDERTVVRFQDGFRIYGTPWHGSLPVYSPSSAPLAAILFLKQGPRNELVEIGRSDAAKRLMVCGYLPFWSAAAMGASLDLLDRLTAQVPCLELTFV
ncbi:MAG TPA: hypothetical protein VLC52_01800, partial [Anaerolineae bacterium]|nr:hypothetical protein [Anaerolineae bacterium]